jgi:hypothetical protein
MFPDHDGVDRSWISECEECKSARLAIRIPDDRTELGNVISHAVWLNGKKKKHHTPPDIHQKN